MGWDGEAGTEGKGNPRSTSTAPFAVITKVLGTARFDPRLTWGGGGAFTSQSAIGCGLLGLGIPSLTKLRARFEIILRGRKPIGDPAAGTKHPSCGVVP